MILDFSILRLSVDGFGIKWTYDGNPGNQFILFDGSRRCSCTDVEFMNNTSIIMSSESL